MMLDFEMSNLGKMKYFLSLEIEQSKGCISVSQKKYIGDVLKHFTLEHCNASRTHVDTRMKLTKVGAGKSIDKTLYKQIIGCLMYLTATHPDIQYAVGLVSRYMEKPTEIHLHVAK